jgi:hypothetical protein
MIPENATRSLLIYDAWEKGRSVDSISIETGIPRSTVGYYIRKFNKAARRGEPITIRKVEKKRDEKEDAVTAYVKTSSFVGILEMLKRGEFDKVYKLLSILKLMKELKSDFFASDEEREAFDRNSRYVIEQVASAYILAQNLAQKQKP